MVENSNPISILITFHQECIKFDEEHYGVKGVGEYEVEEQFSPLHVYIIASVEKFHGKLDPVTSFDLSHYFTELLQGQVQMPPKHTFPPTHRGKSIKWMDCQFFREQSMLLRKT